MKKRRAGAEQTALLLPCLAFLVVRLDQAPSFYSLPLCYSLQLLPAFLLVSCSSTAFTLTCMLVNCMHLCPLHAFVLVSCSGCPSRECRTKMDTAVDVPLVSVSPHVAEHP